MEKKILIIICSFIIFCLGIFIVISVLTPQENYNAGLSLYEDENISFKHPKTFTRDFGAKSEVEWRILYLFFTDSEKNQYIALQTEKKTSSLDVSYKNLLINRPNDNNVINSEVEMIEFDGISAIKETVEWNTNIFPYKYSIHLSFMHKENRYYFSFSGDDLNAIESNYNFVKSSLKLK